MAYTDFTLSGITKQFGLSISENLPLFDGIVAVPLDPAFVARLNEDVAMALSISPEKARSEFIIAPILMLVEAKNEEVKRGYAPCIAEMLGAQAFNLREGLPPGNLYGIVTIGNIWRFLHLRDSAIAIDRREYYLENVAEIMAILLHLTRPE